MAEQPTLPASAIATSRRLSRGRLATLLLLALALWSVFVLASENLPPSRWLPEATVVTHFVNTTQCDNSSNETNNTSVTSAAHQSAIHVLFALSGNHPGFLAEFEASLKSVLLNAPIRVPLEVHVMADRPAFDALPAILNATEVETWRTVVPITITVYNVEIHVQRWTNRLITSMHQFTLAEMTSGHTIGAFFRLFANDVVPPHVQHALYLDPDVVLMSNIEQLWKHLDPHALFHWGLSMCSGFVLLNMNALPEIWDLAEKLDLRAMGTSIRQQPNDQLIFRAINITHPERVSVLPPEWDISIADEVWRFRKTIVQNRPQVGMIHFNGGGSSKEAFFETHSFLTDETLRWTFGMANYFIRLPWSWARFTVESITSEGQGYPLLVKYEST